MPILANRTNSCTHPFVLCDLAMEYEPETLHPVSLPSRTTRQQSPIAVGVCLRKIIRRRGAKSFCVTIHLRHRIGAFCNHKFLRTSFTTSLAAMASFRTSRTIAECRGGSEERRVGKGCVRT